MNITGEQALEALARVTDPSRNKDIVRLGYVRSLRTEGRTISLTLVLPEPGGAFARSAPDLCRAALRETLGPDVDARIDVDSPMISLGVDVQQAGARRQPGIPEGVRNFLAVASGKGGVGKSTVAVNLAVALARQGYDVGLCDVDIYGPSIPTMMGIRDEKPRLNDQRKIVPLERHGVRLLSMGFLVDPTQAAIWRGPMVSSAVRQFLGDTDWGELDFLVLDLPPGTGDIQLTIVQTVPLTGAIMVSTPQEVALADVRKGVAMFHSVHVPVLGVVENMAYFTPPDLPDRKYYLFGRGGARRLAETLGVPFLGEIPIEQSVREGGDYGQPVVLTDPGSLSAQAFDNLASGLAWQIALRNAEMPPTQPVEILHR